MNIEIIGSKILEVRCSPLENSEFSNGLGSVIQDMYLTMEKNGGVGLAAPQVGIPKRFFIVSRDLPSLQGHYFFANPEIIWPKCELVSIKEGCLSMPGVIVSIERPKTITLSAQDRFGNRFTIENISSESSRVIQHEFDHLDGILMHNRASNLDKMMIASKVKAARRLGKKSNQ